MRIARSVCTLALALAAGCGGSSHEPGNGNNGSNGGGGSDGGSGSDSNPPPAGLQLVYTDPGAGALRLIHDPAGTSAQGLALALVVGGQPLSGYAAGFDLPLDTTRVALTSFTPGTGLDPGQPPRAAQAVIPKQGPLSGMLVTVQSQKASGAGAATGDAALAPGTVLYTVRLELTPGATAGVVFDGTSAGFRLPSGGLRNRAGATVVEAGQVAIGKLEVR